MMRGIKRVATLPCEIFLDCFWLLAKLIDGPTARFLRLLDSMI